MACLDLSVYIFILIIHQLLFLLHFREDLKLPIDTAQRSKRPAKLKRPVPGSAVDLRSPRTSTSRTCPHEHSGARRNLLSPTSSTQTHSPDSLSPRSPLSPIGSDHLDNSSR